MNATMPYDVMSAPRVRLANSDAVMEIATQNAAHTSPVTTLASNSGKALTPMKRSGIDAINTATITGDRTTNPAPAFPARIWRGRMSVMRIMSMFPISSSFVNAFATSAGAKSMVTKYWTAAHCLMMAASDSRLS